MMGARDKLIGVAAKAGFYVVRWMALHLPDRVMGRVLRLVERVVYAVTASRELAQPVAEVADIFESGPPLTDTVRKLMRGAEVEVIESALKCLARPSPYGAA